MRIAISGTHQTGKTSLAEALSQALPSYQLFPEPYVAAAAAGEPCAEFPDYDTFEQMIRASLQTVATCPPTSILDRCPFDMLAYLMLHPESSRVDLRSWMPELQEVLQRLNLIIFIPVETPDRIPFASHPNLRSRIDSELRRFILDDYFGFGVPSIEITGPVEERVRTVLAHVRH